MHPLTRRDGLSLIEVLIAVFMVTSVIVSLSLGFPRTSAQIIQGRQHVIANNLASAEIESLKSQPYGLIDTSDANPLVGAFNTACDCRAVTNYSVFATTSSQVGAATFHTASCISFVTQNPATKDWSFQCSTVPNADQGYKHILVRVWWSQGGRDYSTTQESILTRS